jgi:hypothetical protein
MKHRPPRVFVGDRLEHGQDLAREIHAHGVRMLLLGFLAGVMSAGLAALLAMGWSP